MKVLLSQKYMITINHKKLIRIMRENNLQAVIRRKKPVYIDKSREPLIKENILNRDFKADKSCKKFVTDITYIPIPNMMVYLSVIIDLYDGKVKAYKISTSAKASLSLDVVKELVQKYKLQDALLHSDQGIHYTNYEYINLLKDNKIIQSMSRRGNCWDNARMESFFGHFKCECIRIRKKELISVEKVKELVDEYIEFYNNERMLYNVKRNASNCPHCL